MKGPRTLEVADVLDVRAAQAVSEAVAALSAGESVIVDCRAVRHFEDRALALVASALRAGAGRVALHGLGEHQWRVLGYLGVGDAQQRARAGDPGDQGGADPVSGRASEIETGAPARPTGEGV